MAVEGVAAVPEMNKKPVLYIDDGCCGSLLTACCCCLLSENRRAAVNHLAHFGRGGVLLPGDLFS